MNPKLNALAKTILEASVWTGYSDWELLIVISILQDRLLSKMGDPALRAVLGTIISTEDNSDRAEFLDNLLALCRESPQVH